MIRHSTRYGRTMSRLLTGLQTIPRHTRSSQELSYNLIPHPSEQMLTVGMRGSGKTSFNKILLSRIIGQRPIAILDSKPDDALLLPGSFITESYRDINKWNYRKHPILV